MPTQEKVLRNSDAIIDAIKFLNKEIEFSVTHLDRLKSDILEMTQTAEQEQLTIEKLKQTVNQLQGFD